LLRRAAGVKYSIHASMVVKQKKEVRQRSIDHLAAIDIF
jgi:hypothetical protein